jgi:hypothetical protein
MLNDEGNPKDQMRSQWARDCPITRPALAPLRHEFVLSLKKPEKHLAKNTAPPKNSPLFQPGYYEKFFARTFPLPSPRSLYCYAYLGLCAGFDEGRKTAVAADMRGRIAFTGRFVDLPFVLAIASRVFRV